MFVITGSVQGATGLVFEDREDVERLIGNLRCLVSGSLVIDKPLIYSFFNREVPGFNADNALDGLVAKGRADLGDLIFVPPFTIVKKEDSG